MDIITIKKLSKDFKIKQKEKGLKGSIKAIFRPEQSENADEPMLVTLLGMVTLVSPVQP